MIEIYANTVKSAYAGANQVINVERFGVNGNDSKNDTTGFRLAIESAAKSGQTLYVPSGTYWIDAVSGEPPYHNDFGGILIDNKTDIIIEMNDGAKIKCIKNNSPGYAIINIRNSRNITIKGGTIIGDRDYHDGVSGEWGYGIQIRNSQNIQILNTEISNCWGDGIFLGRTGRASVNKNISISNVVMSNNRRQGLSILNAVGLKVANCTISNTRGTDPQAGIDIEPNTMDEIGDIEIIGNSFTNNAGYGITVGGRRSYAGVMILSNMIQGSPWGINIHPNSKFQGFFEEFRVSNNAIVLPEGYAKSIGGIGLFRLSNSIITMNNISKNGTTTQTSSREYGFYVDDDVFGNIIEGNSVSNTYWGIYYKKNRVRVKKIDLFKNVFINNEVIANE